MKSLSVVGANDMIAFDDFVVERTASGEGDPVIFDTDMDVVFFMPWNTRFKAIGPPGSEKPGLIVANLIKRIGLLICILIGRFEKLLVLSDKLARQIESLIVVS